MSGAKSIKLYADRPYIILCEGQDEFNFLCQYIDFQVKQGLLPDVFNIIIAGGINNISSALENIKKLDGFSMQKGLLIVRDSETDANGAKQAMEKAFIKSFGCTPDTPCRAKFAEVGIYIGYCLIPGPDNNNVWQNGTLEDLCWRIVDKDKFPELEVMQKSVMAHIQQSETIRNKSFKRIHKNKLHNLMSVTDEFVGMKIGEMSKANAFNFNHSGLIFLKKALLSIYANSQCDN